jgi:hypothetical protein
MLTIGGPSHRQFCDGVSRRDFLKVGALAMGGLGLPQVLRAEASIGRARSHKAVIMVFLAGGPPHQDMFDLKMAAPVGIRGEFKPIETNVPGLEICEHMPRLAAIADKYAVIRSIVGCDGDHSAGQCLTGYSDRVSKLQGGRPALGSIVSKLQGAVDSTVPTYIGLSPKTGERRWGNPGEPGFLGLAHAPFAPFRGEAFTPREMAISLDRLADRKGLLGQLDNLRRRLDSSEAIRGLDNFEQQAFDIITSPKLFGALDLNREDPRLRARYGIGDMKNEADGPPCCMDHFLMARRLVEAGARCVTISFGRWDTHGQNFRSNAKRIPKLDMALSALIEDLYVRGLEKDVTVVVWGEFGRTPQINKDAGRDHWPPVSFALLAGGGLRTGQVIGSTDRHGAQAKDRPVHVQDVFATLYNRLGIGPDATIPDRAGRPVRIIDSFEPIRELI